MKQKIGIGLVAVAVLFGVLLAGCPTTGIVCQPGTNACGDGCADFTSDKRNCGGCGLACQTIELCKNSQCVCPEGATQCAGKCVVLATDPQNCGTCGTPCTNPGDICAPNSSGVGTCQAAPVGDAGVTDAGQGDAGIDAGELDAGTDAGSIDAGELDAGTDGGSDGGP